MCWDIVQAVQACLHSLDNITAVVCIVGVVYILGVFCMPFGLRLLLFVYVRLFCMRFGVRACAGRTTPAGRTMRCKKKEERV